MALTPPHTSLSPLCHPDPLFPRAWLLFLLFELPDGDIIREATAPAPVFLLHLFRQPSITSGLYSLCPRFVVLSKEDQA